MKISKTFAEMSEFERWQELVRLTTVLGSDRQLRQVDALYLPGLSRGMIESGNLLMLAAKLRQDNVAHTISFDGSNGEGWDGKAGKPTAPGSAWPGRGYYISELECFGVPNDLIVPAKPGYHSRGETDGLIATAIEEGWKTIYILTVAYHIPRVFSCVVASMIEADFYPRVYMYPPPRTDWDFPMAGSQSVEVTTTPFDESLKDLGKVLAYMDYWLKDRTQGGATFKEIYDYLNRRDAGRGSQYE